MNPNEFLKVAYLEGFIEAAKEASLPNNEVDYLIKEAKGRLWSKVKGFFKKKPKQMALDFKKGHPSQTTQVQSKVRQAASKAKPGEQTGFGFETTRAPKKKPTMADTPKTPAPAPAQASAPAQAPAQAPAPAQKSRWGGRVMGGLGIAGLGLGAGYGLGRYQGRNRY